jgi:hypothetical protein
MRSVLLVESFDFSPSNQYKLVKVKKSSIAALGSRNCGVIHQIVEKSENISLAERLLPSREGPCMHLQQSYSCLSVVCSVPFCPPFPSLQ